MALFTHTWYQNVGKVSVALHHLELFPVNKKANFQIHVETEENAELAVSIAGPRNDLPVQVRYIQCLASAYVTENHVYPHLQLTKCSKSPKPIEKNNLSSIIKPQK